MRWTGLGSCFGLLLFALLLAAVAGAGAAPSRISIASASPHTYSFRSQVMATGGCHLTIRTNQTYRLKNRMPEGLTSWRLTMACVKEKLTPQAEDDGTTSYHVDPDGFSTLTVKGTSAQNLIENHTYQVPGKVPGPSFRSSTAPGQAALERWVPDPALRQLGPTGVLRLVGRGSAQGPGCRGHHQRQRPHLPLLAVGDSDPDEDHQPISERGFAPVAELFRPGSAPAACIGAPRRASPPTFAPAPT